MNNHSIKDALLALGINDKHTGTSTGKEWFGNSGELIISTSPVDNEFISSVHTTTPEDFEMMMQTAESAYKQWRQMPAPKRGEIVRQFGDKLRQYKDPLGKLVSYEMGKSLAEGLGEVQEMIDICDFAVGLSRQLYGLTMHSERPGHRMYEQYQPIGIVGIISAFNFPVAVWCWNSAIAWVCGDVCVWKPSEKAPICGVACQKLFAEVMVENNLPEGLSCLVNGDYKIGERMSTDTRIPLISATGSTRMGKAVAVKVAERLGRSLLELGGNNAIIISEHADIDLAIPSVVFGAVGTAGQRCTTTRRLIIHESIYDNIVTKLQKAYKQLKVGNPLDSTNHVGPLIDRKAVEMYLTAMEEVKKEGGKELVAGGVFEGEGFESGCYVMPSIFEVENHFKMVQHETFAPILYVMKYSTLAEAIDMQNAVVQGLSSSIMTLNMREAEMFLSYEGSDCGIANVNIGTSGAEIGGAFGGEKETGGGRESGSDAWKAYMRRQTNTICYTDKPTLAQGITFEL